MIPRTRYLGNAVLSLLTKIASGYWHVADSQAGLHGARPRRAAPARPRPHLPPLRLPQRHPRAPERDQRPRAGHPLAADLRGRRALGHPSAQGRAADLVAARQGLLLAHAGEVRDPRLPPARLLLRARLPDARVGLALGISETILRILGNQITTATIVLVALLLVSGSSSRSSPCGSTWSRTRTCASCLAEFGLFGRLTRLVASAHGCA